MGIANIRVIYRPRLGWDGGGKAIPAGKEKNRTKINPTESGTKFFSRGSCRVPDDEYHPPSSLSDRVEKKMKDGGR